MLFPALLHRALVVCAAIARLYADAAYHLDRRHDKLTVIIDALLTTACIFVIANRLTD